LVQIYDPVADSWTTGTPMPTARGAAMAAVIDGRIAVFGGVSAAVGSCSVSACTSANLAVTEVYDPSTDTWSSGSALTTAASEMAAGVVSDGTRAFAIGSGIFGVAGSNVQELGYMPSPQ
jgi:N-acetylneuraminic acid mutarotase